MLVLGPASSEKSLSNDGLPAALLKLMDHLVGSRQYCVIKGRLTINKKAILDPSDVIAYRAASKLNAEEWSRRYELQVSSDGQR